MTEKLLTEKDPHPVRVINEKGASPVVIVCDHAGRRVPRKLKNLGLPRAELSRHIGWDPGTAAIGRHLARALDAVAVMSVYSRLVVDLNRGKKSPECIRTHYDGTDVPGNIGLGAARRRARLSECFDPYHAEVARQIRRVRARGQVPVILSVHSFTPRLRGGKKRPWQIGVLWNDHKALAKKLIRSLQKRNPRLVIGDNEPYSLKAAALDENTVSRHAGKNGLPSLIIEVRQDLVATPDGAKRWADILLASLADVL